MPDRVRGVCAVPCRALWFLLAGNRGRATEGRRPGNWERRSLRAEVSSIDPSDQRWAAAPPP